MATDTLPYRVVCLYTSRLLWSGQARDANHARAQCRKSGNPGAYAAYADNSAAVQVATCETCGRAVTACVHGADACERYALGRLRPAE